MNKTELFDALEQHYGDHFRRTSDTRAMVEIATRDRRSQVVSVLLFEQMRDEVDTSRVITETSIGPVPRRGFDFQALLRRNADLHVGAICIADLRTEEGTMMPYFILRATHLLQSLTFEGVWDMVEQAARAADELERDLFGRDVH